MEQEVAAHQQKMRAGGLALSQGTRRILQERERHARKAGQAAAAITASGILDQVCVLCICVLMMQEVAKNL